MSNRVVYSILKEFVETKFVFLSGPRQVGKTTLAKAWLEKNEGLYLNWDFSNDRKSILKQDFLEEPRPLALVFDEVHKYPRWKSYIKGLYDKEAKKLKVIVTGSAKLDIYQRGGDSLFGRYELIRLHPYTIGELTHQKILPPPKDWLNLSPEIKPETNTWEHLKNYSGFPEPFLKQNVLHYGRWSQRRFDLLLRQDLRDLTEIKTLSLVEQLMLLLPERVGSPLSVNSLRGDLLVAHDTASLWLNALERLYLVYRISPYSHRINRSIRLEKKLYLWDWAQVETEGPCFENMVASHLLKAVHLWNDLGYGPYDLMYLRDREKKEVDFVMTHKRKPVVLIECKLSDESLSPTLYHFGAMLGNIPKIQLIQKKGVDRLSRSSSSRVVSAETYLTALP